MKYGQKKRKNVTPLLLLLCFAVAGLGVYVASNWQQDNSETELIRQEISVGNDGEDEEGNQESASVDKGAGSRRIIFDKNMEVLAQSIEVASIYIRPLELKDRQTTVIKLAEMLDLDEELLLEKMRIERSYIWLKQDVSTETALKIRELHLNGVYVENEGRRFYPFKNHASHVVGFAEKEHGLAGVEFIYDSLLRGENVAKSRLLETFPESETNNLSGTSLVLSISIDLQILLEAKLELLLKKVDGHTGSVVLMDAQNGEVYALANQPSFDPNIFWKADNFDRKNRAIDTRFNLGGLGDVWRVSAEIYGGNEFKSDELGETEIADRIIRPRRAKKFKGGAISGPKGWHKWGEDGFVSPLLVWPNGYKAVPKEINDFCNKIGVGATYLSDQSWLEKNRKQVGNCSGSLTNLSETLIGMTNSFSQLVNGGHLIHPQIVHRLWLDEQNKFVEKNENGVKEGIGEVASTNIKQFLKSLYRQSVEENIYVESFTPQSQAEDEVTLEGVTSSGKGETVLDDVATEELRGTSLLIGGELDGERQLVIGVIVDGARVNTAKMSSFKKFANEVLKKAKKQLEKSKKQKINPPQMLQYDKAFKKWSEGQDEQTVSKFAGKKNEKQIRMPDLRGLSLRKALQDINGMDLNVTIQGAGTVVQQSIKPGSKILNTTDLQMILKIDQ